MRRCRQYGKGSDGETQERDVSFHGLDHPFTLNAMQPFLPVPFDEEASSHSFRRYAFQAPTFELPTGQAVAAAARTPAQSDERVKRKKSSHIPTGHSFP